MFIKALDWYWINTDRIKYFDTTVTADGKLTVRACTDDGFYALYKGEDAVKEMDEIVAGINYDLSSHE